MKNEINFKEILENINSGLEENKPNCSIGLFVKDYYEETTKDVAEFIVKKPMVKISSFVEDNELFYSISFHFKSFNDSDYKQLWKIICNFIEKSKREGERLTAGETLEKVSGLSVSVVPEKYNGKYFAYINMPYSETFSRRENAFDGTAEITFFCEEGSFGILSCDDDMIDRRSIEREAEQEIDAEIGT